MSPALVVLAAGLATRFGRLKQLEPVGPAGESLLDFTIHDAAAAGFEEVIVLVRNVSLPTFAAHFEAFPPRIPFRLVVQERDDRPATATGNWKPWGTAHAVLSAAPHVTDAFGVANADDFYGTAAMRALAGWLRSGEGDAAVIAFRLDRTLSPHGGVSRAICSIRDGWLTGLAEHTDIVQTDAGIVSRTDDGERVLDAATPVSMNLWGFHPSVLRRLRSAFASFRSERAGDASAEFRLPDVIAEGIGSGELQVRLIETDSAWTGLTFEADTPAVMEQLRRAVDAGLYPRPQPSDSH